MRSGLQLKNVAYEHAANNVSFVDLDLEVKPGEIVSVIGKSGTGKSTIIKLIAGFINPSNAGYTRKWNDKEIKQPDSRIKIVFQEYPNAIFEWLTVKQDLLIGDECSSTSNPFMYKDVINIMFSKEELRNQIEEKFVKDLSGGQKQRVQLARVLLADPELIILDEPDSSLDIDTKDTLIRYIVSSHNRYLKDENKLTWIIVTHDLKLAAWISNKILFIEKNDNHTFFSMFDGYKQKKSIDESLADKEFEALYLKLRNALNVKYL